jgi:hypothetical protein
MAQSPANPSPVKFRVFDGNYREPALAEAKCGFDSVQGPSHGGNTGSNPIGDVSKMKSSGARIGLAPACVRKIYGIDAAEVGARKIRLKDSSNPRQAYRRIPAPRPLPDRTRWSTSLTCFMT